jgi:hypothetical protein
MRRTKIRRRAEAQCHSVLGAQYGKEGQTELTPFSLVSVRDQARGLQRLTPFVPLLRFFGVLRLRDKLQPTTITGSKLSQAAMQEVSALALRPNFLPAVLQEYATLGTESANQVRSVGNLGTFR